MRLFRRKSKWDRMLGTMATMAAKGGLRRLSKVGAGVIGGAAGLGYALAVPAWNALTLDRIPHEARGTLLGLVAALQGVGLALGPSVGGTLWESASHVAPFMAAAAALSLGALLALFVRDT